MHKICIILAYFGPLPEWFNLWLLSCHYNPTISFLIVTDQSVTIPEGYDNVHVLPMTLSQMKDMADKKTGNEYCIGISLQVLRFKTCLWSHF